MQYFPLYNKLLPSSQLQLSLLTWKTLTDFLSDEKLVAFTIRMEHLLVALDPFSILLAQIGLFNMLSYSATSVEFLSQIHPGSKSVII